MDYRLHATSRGSEILLAPPWDSPSTRLYSQQLTLDGLQMRRAAGRSHATQRRIAMITRRRGDIAFNAEFSILELPRRAARRPEKTTLTAEDRQRDLGGEPGIDPRDEAVQSALARLTATRSSQAELIQRIFDFVHGQLAYSAAQGASAASEAIAARRATSLGRVRAMVALCRAAQIPARIVTGFALADEAEAPPLQWVQVYSQGRWLDYDPTRGFAGHLPANYVAFSREGPLLLAEGASVLNAEYQVIEDDLPTTLTGTGHTNLMEIFDLDRLPLSARTTLATLLLLPLGALLNAFVRSVVGVQTFGTFTPAMLALAAIYVDWLTALVIFAVVAVIALFGRSMLPGFNLSRAPRLTIVFALVALAMALAVSIMAYFDLLTGARVVLLPIVILTSLVDRVYTVVDEQGLYTALIRLLWTGVTAVGCFFILSAEELGEWLVRYPEIHLITIALVLALAVYRGPQLARIAGNRKTVASKTRSEKPDDGD